MNAILKNTALFWSIVGSASLTRADSTGPATLTILSPTEGDTIHTRDFDLLFSTDGDTTTARLDHTHWQLSEYPNTTADLSGVVHIHAPRDGDHELIVYMATPEHIVINQKYHVHFRVITQGVVFLAPASDATINSSDLTINFNTYGDLPDGSVIQLTLDANTPITAAVDDGTFTFGGLADGAHTVHLQIVDANSVAVGDEQMRQFTIASALSPENAKKAAGYLKNALRASNTKSKLKLIKKVRTVISSMQSGGSANPADPQCTSANAATASTYVNRLVKKPGDSKTASKLAKLLRTMAS